MFVLMFVLEVFLFVLEMAQMRVLRWQKWLSLGNCTNIASILLLLMASLGYLVARELHVDNVAWQNFSTVLLQNVGSVGLGLKWLGLLGLLDSFQCTPHFFST